MLDKPRTQQPMDRSFALAVTLFAITLALLFVLQSPLFTMQSVQLSGQHLLTTDVILSIAGIAYGDNLFDVNVRHATEQLMKHPQIAQAKVKRQFPRTVRIDIVERIPVAILPYAEGFAALDAHGRVLVLSDQLWLPYPLLTGIDPSQASSLQPGQQLQDPLLADSLRVAAALPSDLLATVGEIGAVAQGITLHTRDGIVVVLGDTSQLQEKLQTLSALQRSLSQSGQHVVQIDLRVPRTPVLR